MYRFTLVLTLLVLLISGCAEYRGGSDEMVFPIISRDQSREMDIVKKRTVAISTIMQKTKFAFTEAELRTLYGARSKIEYVAETLGYVLYYKEYGISALDVMDLQDVLDEAYADGRSIIVQRWERLDLPTQISLDHYEEQMSITKELTEKAKNSPSKETVTAAVSGLLAQIDLIYKQLILLSL